MSAPAGDAVSGHVVPGDVDTGDAPDLLLDLADRLVFRRGLMDRGEAAWLHLLSQFDRDGLWALDGQTSCAHWLEWRAQMAIGTALEKCRIAAELDRRPLLCEAFDAGEISYSAVRAITRIDRPDPEVDAVLIAVAKTGTVRDVERAVRTYRAYADQERDPDELRAERRGIRITRGYGSLSTAELTLTDLEMDEFVTALRAHDEYRTRIPDCEAKDSVPDGDDALGTVDDVDDASPDGEHGPESTAVDHPVDEPSRGGSHGDAGAGGPETRVPAWQRRADAFMDLLRHAMADDLTAAYATAGDRYLVHLVVDPGSGRAQQLDGSPVSTNEAAQILCDASVVEHRRDETGELVNLGRKTREWSTAQRRAIAVRDGGHCRFPGCTNTTCDIHHLREWTNGGPTDIANGGSLCRYHHGLVHRGFAATGNADGAITFRRPDGTLLDTTHPLSRNWQLAA